MQQSITITPLDLEEGLVILYIYDITFLSEINYKLEIAKKSLSEKNEELRLILDTTMEAIIIFKDNSVVDCNKIAIELFNKQMKYELINKSFNDLIHNKNRDILNEKEPFETNLIREDGSEFNAIINIKDTSLNNQIFKIVTIVDIEDLKRKENLMAEQTKLAAMGEMLGNIAHQWRQPLSVITTVATGMKLQKEFENLDDKTFDEAIENITNSALYLSKTIDDFRSFFKSDKKETFFSIKETFEKVLKLTNSQFKNHEITIIKEIDDFQIYGFENEFIQVLINILNNSKDALINKKENKLIFIKTFEDDENNFVIKIKDNGGGIENKILDKVCEPYFTTKHQSTGTGIGLYMAEEIIEKHMNGILEINNCKFSYENEEYVGAEVTILLNKES